MFIEDEAWPKFTRTRDNPGNFLVICILACPQCPSPVDNHYCTRINLLGTGNVKILCTVSARKKNIAGYGDVSLEKPSVYRALRKYSRMSVAESRHAVATGAVASYPIITNADTAYANPSAKALTPHSFTARGFTTHTNTSTATGGRASAVDAGS